MVKFMSHIICLKDVRMTLDIECCFACVEKMGHAAGWLGRREGGEVMLVFAKVHLFSLGFCFGVDIFYVPSPCLVEDG